METGQDPGRHPLSRTPSRRTCRHCKTGPRQHEHHDSRQASPLGPAATVCPPARHRRGHTPGPKRLKDPTPIQTSECLTREFRRWRFTATNGQGRTRFAARFPVQGRSPHSPVGAVGVAQATHVVGVRELPDQRVVFSHDAGRAGLDAVGAVDVVRTLHTLVWSLHRGGERHLFTQVRLFY